MKTLISRKSKLVACVGPVFEFLRNIPLGKVVTYSHLARACGVPTARNIGWILQKNTDPDAIPCYKVVRSDGTVTDGYKFGGKAEQQRRLEAEGIEFEGDRIRDFPTQCVT